jgi:hypothetical protein
VVLTKEENFGEEQTILKTIALDLTPHFYKEYAPLPHSTLFK